MITTNSFAAAETALNNDRNRLSQVTLELLSSNQLMFTRGRLISDNVFLAEEMVRGGDQRNMPRRAYLVLDLTKAFDSVSWEALMKVM